MTPDDFCRWLQGFAELHGERPTSAQWDLIREHLQLVYKKETSKREDLADILKRNGPPSTPGRIC